MPTRWNQYISLVSKSYQLANRLIDIAIENMHWLCCYLSRISISTPSSVSSSRIRTDSSLASMLLLQKNNQDVNWSLFPFFFPLSPALYSVIVGWKSNTWNLEPLQSPLQPHTFERREHPESQRSHCKERSFYYCTLVHHHGLGDGNVMWIKVFW